MQNASDTESWRPRFIDNVDELSELSADPHIEVIDRIDQQHRDLARVLPPPDDAVLNEASRWYYYPWRRSVVHVLGPQSFRMLRSDRNRNKITATEQETLRRLTIGVVGLSVGHAIAHTLALEGICGEIRLADFDEIELSNLNRIPGTVFDLGINKAVVAARRISELDPYLEVKIEPDGLDLGSVDDFMSGMDIVIEECDSFDVKLAVRAAAKRQRIPLIMETSDRGLLDIERYDVEPDRPLFHGLLGDAKAEEMMGLSTHDKVPYVLRVLEPDQLSAVMAASMTEVDETVATWPQLGGDINLGSATVAAAVRTLGLGKPLSSGRVRVDINAMLGDIRQPDLRADPASHDEAGVDPEPAPNDAVAAAVHAARLAPSGGNTQPWTFHVSESALDIHLDPRQTSTLDVAYRGSHVAIGASLFNAQVAAAHRGILGRAEIYPHGTDDAPVARLTFADGHDARLAALYDAMVQRVSNRHLTEPLPLPDDVVPALQQSATDEGAEAFVVTDRQRLLELSELFGESDRVRYLTEHLHAEMMRELRWPGEDSLDWGLDVRTLELDKSDLAKLAVARRADIMSLLAQQDLGRALGEASRDRIGGASGLVVVAINGTTPADYVRGGKAVEKVWIQAELLGLSVQAISPVFIYAVDRPDYEELSPRYSDRLRQLHHDFNGLTGMNDRSIALTMRIGYAPHVSARSKRLSADHNVSGV
ncbi:Rv1355c family protein [Phytoactinopolyspora endophytica]|uniref:Rv1355c family protein n=1 Tax=Phytoactinopolyspora endophytica TaxID=1642495 RepID=UPI00101BC602|nr:Rv1355c family protein [Phytoactinopolyspora endophytica]